MVWDHLDPWDDKVRDTFAVGEVECALDALVRGFQEAIVGYCINMLGDVDAGEEVAQEVFAAACDAIHRFRWESKVRTWVFGIARNLCLKHMKKAQIRALLQFRKRSAIEEEVHLKPPLPPDYHLMTQQEQEQLTQLSQGLAKLRKRERDLLMMRYYGGLSFNDIGKHLHRSEATARTWVQNAEARLKQLMD